MSLILKAENISKQYRLGTVGTGTLSDDLKRWWYSIRGKEDPFLKVGAVNERGTKANEDYVWALRDINFEVKQGEVLGIIGRNGAGKSTLLKMLSRVTAPTTGTIKTKGRIASLLEIGTGFHGELTGRENIFMNGAVLGMSRLEIKKKLDEIVAFSGCEMYIDTPVKRYSSGMTVRLGFAVAAHLEPEILVVDEVLAVGDSEFQKKAIGKMQDLSTGEGRTVLFVSHNMGSVKRLCSRAIVLKNGIINFAGETEDAIQQYLNIGNTNPQAIYKAEKPEATDFVEISLRNSDLEIQSNFGFEEKITVHIKFNLSRQDINRRPILGLKLTDNRDRSIFSTQYFLEPSEIKEGMNSLIVELPQKLLSPFLYHINVALHIPNIEVLKAIKSVVSFSIEETDTLFYTYKGRDTGCVRVNCVWKILG